MATILLPPKSFLLMPCPLFFQQQDTIVDVFNQVLFWKNVHRVYSHPLAQPDSPWAVIILLVLGQDQQILTTSESVMQSQLVGPLITSTRRSSTSIKLLMAPKLIDIQALILLHCCRRASRAGHFRSSARACLRTRKADGSPPTPKKPRHGTPADCEERLKVFRSLSLREKSLCISHSADDWLSSAHCSMYLDLGKQMSVTKMSAMRLHLALLQEETTTILNSTRYPDSNPQGKATIKRLEQAFEDWLNEYAELNNPDSTVSIDLTMDLYACRFTALQHSSDPKHKNSKDPVEIVPKQEMNGVTNQDADPAFPLCSLPESFSCIGYFTMVKSMLSTDSEETCREDLHLLQSVCQIFKKYELNTLGDNYTQKVPRTFQALLAIVYNIKPGLFQDQHSEFPEDSVLNSIIDLSDNPTSHSSFKTTISERSSPNSSFAKVNVQQYQIGLFDVESLSASMRQSPFDLDILESFNIHEDVHLQDSTIAQLVTLLNRESSNKRPRLSTPHETILPHKFSFSTDLSPPLMTEIQNAIQMWQ
ncbi:C6 transcription factor [Talaromyces pinophilus]|uniref:C6 transcription factor n=1 Tax=Talaromyces pinophilus TaxID=128442 RepID=A0A0B8N632_TALPI|nr:C6 transcription factor [Talaromyces pinophilus]